MVDFRKSVLWVDVEYRLAEEEAARKKEEEEAKKREEERVCVVLFVCMCTLYLCVSVFVRVKRWWICDVCLHRCRSSQRGYNY